MLCKNNERSKIYMKKIVQFLLLVLTIFSITGCTDSYEEESLQASDTSSQNDFNYLSELDGWWYRPDDYVSGGTYPIDIFEVDSLTESICPYNKYGTAGYTVDCDADEDSFTIYTQAGFLTLHYDGKSLLNDEGDVEYIHGEPLEPFDTSVFYGKWYKNGDVNGDYYIISNGSYQSFTSYTPDEPIISGTWEILDNSRLSEDVSYVDEMTLEFTENVGEGLWCSMYIPSEDFVALYDNDFSNCYIKEDALGTSAGTSALQKSYLTSKTWYGTENERAVLTFSYYGIIGYAISTPDGSTIDPIGTWSISGETITLNFNDGTSEDATLSENKITITYLDETFERQNW